MAPPPPVIADRKSAPANITQHAGSRPTCSSQPPTDMNDKPTNRAMTAFVARRVTTQTARPPALKAAYDKYSVAMQQYKKLLKLVHPKHHPAPLPQLTKRTDIGAIKKRAETLMIRCSKLQPFAAVSKQATECIPPHRRVLLGPAVGSMPRAALESISSPATGSPTLANATNVRRREENLASAPPRGAALMLRMQGLKTDVDQILHDLNLGGDVGKDRKLESDIDNRREEQMELAEREGGDEQAELSAPAQSRVARDDDMGAKEAGYVAESGCDTAPGHSPVLISEGDAFLIMHLWELYPGLGHQLSKVVRTLRAHGITAHHLEDGSWPNLEEVDVLPALVDIVTRELRVMRAVAEEVERELHQTGHTGMLRGFGP